MKRFVPVLAILAACGDDLADDGGQFGEENGASCEAIDRAPLAVDEASSLGFAPQSLLDVAEGAHPDVLDWLALGTSTPLALTVRYDGGAMEFVDYEYVTTGTANVADIGCADLVEVVVSVDFSTDDGAFGESWVGRLTSPVADAAAFHVDLDAVNGTFDPWDSAPAGNDYDALRAWLDVGFDAAGVRGELSGQGSGTDGTRDDGVAWAENLAIGAWGVQTTGR